MKDTRFDLTADSVKRFIVTDEKFEKTMEDVINGKYEPHWIGEILNIPSTGGGLDSTSYDVNRFG
jgi:hypothetical protein